MVILHVLRILHSYCIFYIYLARIAGIYLACLSFLPFPAVEQLGGKKRNHEKVRSDPQSS